VLISFFLILLIISSIINYNPNYILNNNHSLASPQVGKVKMAKLHPLFLAGILTTVLHEAQVIIINFVKIKSINLIRSLLI
jgi:hypothetical protein